MNDASDLELLEKARAGDRAALELLLERHQAQVYRFGMKMCRDPEDAKDVLQDTLLALARGVRDLRGTSSISTWLFAVARSFCIKKRRKDKRTAHDRSLESEGARHAEALQVQDHAQPADEAVASRQVEHALEHAIQGLAPSQREVLLLRDVEGLSAKEVAEVLGVNVQAVKSRLHRARLAVREAIAPVLGTIDAPARAGCPKVLALYSRYLEDEISADLCTQMMQHVDDCQHCRDTCASLKNTLALCRASSAAAQVPKPVQQQVKAALRAALEDSEDDQR